MKRLFVCLAAAGLLCSAAFADVSFENEVSSDIVNIQMQGSGDSSAEFAGITETVTAEYKGNALDFKVSLPFALFSVANSGNDNAVIDWISGVDAYVEFRPISMLSIVWNDEIFTDGSCLPAGDTNSCTGNIGNDFGVVFRPLKDLRIGAGVSFRSVVFGDDIHIKTNFGADYRIADMVQIGLSFRDVFSDDRSIGAYASLYGVDKLLVNFGYTYNGSLSSSKKWFATIPFGGSFISAGASCNYAPFTFKGDLATAFGDNSGYDLYIGADVGYSFSKAFRLDVNAAFFVDYASNALPVIISLYPGFEYKYRKHTFGFGGKLGIRMDDSTWLSFPVYWKYKL